MTKLLTPSGLQDIPAYTEVEVKNRLISEVNNKLSHAHCMGESTVTLQFLSNQYPLGTFQEVLEELKTNGYQVHEYRSHWGRIIDWEIRW